MQVIVGIVLHQKIKNKKTEGIRIYTKEKIKGIFSVNWARKLEKNDDILWRLCFAIFAAFLGAFYWRKVFDTTNFCHGNKKARTLSIKILLNWTWKLKSLSWFSLCINGYHQKRLWHRCFAVNFTKFLGTPFLTEHIRWLLLYDI